MDNKSISPNKTNLKIVALKIILPGIKYIPSNLYK